MSNLSFEDALDAVANASNQPKYSIGQPLWARGSHIPHCYIVIGIHRPMFGAWKYDVVLEIDPTGPVYMGLEDYFTSEPPVIDAPLPDHPGTIYFTGNGVPLKSIAGGFPELTRAP